MPTDPTDSRLGTYDHTRELVIDPTLIVAHYFSGSYQVIAESLGHDSKGLIYVGGITSTTDLPLAGTPFQSTEGGGLDLFFAVINPALSPARRSCIPRTSVEQATKTWAGWR